MDEDTMELYDKPRRAQAVKDFNIIVGLLRRHVRMWKNKYADLVTDDTDVRRQIIEKILSKGLRVDYLGLDGVLFVDRPN
jgi:hypothetical protein